jgi:hypothetical protein
LTWCPVYTYHIFLIHSSVGRMGCFQSFSLSWLENRDHSEYYWKVCCNFYYVVYFKRLILFNPHLPIYSYSEIYSCSYFHGCIFLLFSV